mmetsp:Transcript_39463/g.91578  ORF Transcript_39463/g.91578 Transcript_39463/m.91578 type:complete len:126 (-) Transcript_39463:373-750(-)
MVDLFRSSSYHGPTAAHCGKLLRPYGHVIYAAPKISGTREASLSETSTRGPLTVRRRVAFNANLEFHELPAVAKSSKKAIAVDDAADEASEEGTVRLQFLQLPKEKPQPAAGALMPETRTVSAPA